jgi:hypothetical protein
MAFSKFYAERGIKIYYYISYKYLFIKTGGILHRAKKSTFNYCHRQLKTNCTAKTVTSKQLAVKDI